MDAELVSLASTGATTLVGLMVTDGWAQVRSRVAALFGRGGEAELDQSRQELLAARDEDDADLAADVESHLRTRLRRALQADPELAGRLRELLDELSPRQEASGGLTVHNTINGGSYEGPVIMAGRIDRVNPGP
jgi:hypothetical protein